MRRLPRILRILVVDCIERLLPIAVIRLVVPRIIDRGRLRLVDGSVLGRPLLSDLRFLLDDLPVAVFIAPWAGTSFSLIHFLSRARQIARRLRARI